MGEGVEYRTPETPQMQVKLNPASIQSKHVLCSEDLFKCLDATLHFKIEKDHG